MCVCVCAVCASFEIREYEIKFHLRRCVIWNILFAGGSPIALTRPKCSTFNWLIHLNHFTLFLIELRKWFAPCRAALFLIRCCGASVAAMCRAPHSVCHTMWTISECDKNENRASVWMRNDDVFVCVFGRHAVHGERLDKSYCQNASNTLNRMKNEIKRPTKSNYHLSISIRKMFSWLLFTHMHFRSHRSARLWA